MCLSEEIPMSKNSTNANLFKHEMVQARCYLNSSGESPKGGLRMSLRDLTRWPIRTRRCSQVFRVARLQNEVGTKSVFVLRWIFLRKMPMESQTSVSKRAPRELQNWRAQGNPPTLCQPFANPSPTPCQPFLPTPLQAPPTVDPRHPFRDTV